MSSKKIFIWLGILVVAVVALIAVWLVLFLRQPSLETPLEEKQPIETREEEEKEELSLANEVFSYQGRIIEIQPNKIVFEAGAQENYLEKDTLLTGLLTEETTYLRIGLAKTLPKDIPEGESPSLFKREKINFSDLKVGDKITVISNSNIKGKSEFEVARIEIIGLGAK